MTPAKIQKLLGEEPDMTKWDANILPRLHADNPENLPAEDIEAMFTKAKSNFVLGRVPEEPASPEEIEQDIRDNFKKNVTGTTYKLATYLVQKYHIISLGDRDRGEIYTYQDGKYTMTNDALVCAEIQRILGDAITKNAKKETLHKIIDSTRGNHEDFEKADRHLIPLKNGVYDIRTGKCLPHSPDYKFLFQFPVEFVEGAKCDNFYAFVKDIMKPEDIPSLQEYLGFIFWRSYSYKKAVIMVGEPNTGKTSLLNVVRELVGVPNIMGISLQELMHDKFAAINLFAKHLNLVDDLSPDDVTNIGLLKMLTGNGSIFARPLYGVYHHFINIAKLLFACNQIPEIKGTRDNAYYERWIIWQFLNEIPKERKKHNIHETLTTPAELQGIFIWAMEGLVRLLKQGEFSNPRTVDETRTLMMMNASSVGRFVSTMLTRESEIVVTRQQMYDYYASFCQEEDLTPVNSNKFGREFTEHCNFATEIQQKNYVNGRERSEKAWRGVAVKGALEAIPTEAVPVQEAIPVEVQLPEGEQTFEDVVKAAVDNF